LPTGTGGVLYRPRFFHSIVFDKRFRSLTGTADDLMFRLACMANNISVVIACKDLRYGSRQVRRCPTAMSFFDSFQPDPQKERLQAEEIEEVSNHTMLQSLSESLTREELEQEVTVGRRLKDSHGGHKDGSKPKKGDHKEGSRKTNSSSSSLFDINKRNKNDIQWSFAQRYLKYKKVLDLQEVVRRHYREREKHCYLPGKQRNKWECSLLPCRRSNHTKSSRANHSAASR